MRAIVLRESVESTIEIEGYAGFERIGEGGSGVVYRAVRQSTGAQVAVKVLRDVSDRSVAWQRMRREMAALAALGGHANVVQPIEMIEHQGGPALVMDYASGGSVADLMARRHGVLTVGEAALIGRHTAQALAAAHAAGIVHRDIKPHNLLIDAHGQVTVCDFGIASLTRSGEYVDRTSAWSVRYASPEDLDGDRPVGPPSDVYSLGATLLHLVHGAPPTLKDRLAPWVAADTDDRQTAELDSVLAACLHPDPDARPTATELVERLEDLGGRGGERLRRLTADLPGASPEAPTPDQVDDPDREGQSSFDAWWALGESPARPCDDATLRRPGRRSASSPLPPTRRRRRWPIVAGMLVSTLAVSGTAALIWPGRADRGRTPDSTMGAVGPPSSSSPATIPATPGVRAATSVAAGPHVVERPGGMMAIDDDAIEWPFGDVGECLVQRAALPVLQTVSCNEPHDLQRYAVADLDLERFPLNTAIDIARVDAFVAEACAAEFDAFVVSGTVTGGLERPFTRPSATTFEQGDRRFQCLLGSYGLRLVGDAEA